MKRSIYFGSLALALLVACGRGDIEEAQRAWLDDEHRVAKRLLEVRGDHNELRRELDPSRAASLADSGSVERFTRATTMLREHESKLNAMDTMIDKHQLGRDVAIRADDDAAVATGWAAAKVDYEAALAALDVIDRQNDDIASILNDIHYRTAPDTLGSNRSLGDTSRDGAGDRGSRNDANSRTPIDNTIGRDAPEEPE